MQSKVFQIIKNEQKRQEETLLMIPSENYESKNVLKAVGSVLGNKYAEGYPRKRYYQGNANVDELEQYCIDLAKKAFGVSHANVQPLSGAPANICILNAIATSGDYQLSQILSHGGHLSMGQAVNITARLARPVYYHLTKDGEVDWKELEEQALKFKPKVIWAGGTAYTRIFNWEKYAKVADKIGAYFVADISHIPGLVLGGAHPSPVPYAHIVMTTTHKTLRGARGAMILVTEKGMKKDPELAKKIDHSVFPGVQGGPHMNNIAGIAVALEESQTAKFKKYAHQIVANAKELARLFLENGYRLIGNGTENHMIWIDLSNKGIEGWMAAWALEYAGINANRQTIPYEPKSPYFPSGLRLGTPAVTTRGMKEKEMRLIFPWINEVIEYLRRDKRWLHIEKLDKEKAKLVRREFKAELENDKKLRNIAAEVKKLCRKFPVYAK